MNVRLAADENFDWRVLDGFERELGDGGILRAQRAGLAGYPDDAILAWAAANDRVLLSYDRATMEVAAYERLAAGEKMPGVFIVSAEMSFEAILADLTLMLGASLEHEFDGRVIWLPLRD